MPNRKMCTSINKADVIRIQEIILNRLDNLFMINPENVNSSNISDIMERKEQKIIPVKLYPYPNCSHILILFEWKNSLYWLFVTIPCSKAEVIPLIPLVKM